MTARDGRTGSAASAVRRALEDAMGLAVGEGLAVAQVRVAWDELMSEARFDRGPFASRVSSVTGGTVHVEASEAGLAQELSLRADALVWSLNERMKGRPGAHIVVRGLSVSVGRIAS